MQSTRVHARIIQHPFTTLMQGARLDAFYDMERDLFLDAQGCQVQISELSERDGRILERATCTYIPLRLHFSGVNELYCDDFLLNLDVYPEDDPSRTIFYFLSWCQPERLDIYYRLRLPKGDLYFFARQVTWEKREKSSHSVLIERDWSPAPPMPDRLVPRPRQLYRRYGGDPVTIKVNGKIRHRRLFIGELSVQPERRPQVDAVLNLGEDPSRWLKGARLHPNDRAINRGEGAVGMTVPEICEEAQWIIARLEQNQRVLVHCVAGMNRSTTVCCAVLMLLEGLTAEAALERVRQHHPWARPDSHHWLALRWLEMKNKE